MRAAFGLRRPAMIAGFGVYFVDLFGLCGAKIFFACGALVGGRALRAPAAGDTPFHEHPRHLPRGVVATPGGGCAINARSVPCVVGETSIIKRVSAVGAMSVSRDRELSRLGSRHFPEQRTVEGSRSQCAMPRGRVPVCRDRTSEYGDQVSTLNNTQFLKENGLCVR